MNIPFHIHTIGKLYPIVGSIVNNYADGRIEYFGNDLTGKAITDPPKIGAYIEKANCFTLRTESYFTKEIWIHLGNLYFKQVIKTVYDKG